MKRRSQLTTGGKPIPPPTSINVNLKQISNLRQISEQLVSGISGTTETGDVVRMLGTCVDFDLIVYFRNNRIKPRTKLFPSSEEWICSRDWATTDERFASGSIVTYYHRLYSKRCFEKPTPYGSAKVPYGRWLLVKGIATHNINKLTYCE